MRMEISYFALCHLGPLPCQLPADQEGQMAAAQLGIVLVLGWHSADIELVLDWH